MSGIATAIVGGAAIGVIGSSMAADKAAGATEAAAKMSTDAQLAQLDYLKEVDKLPKQYREAALAKIGGAYGVGEPGQQAEFFKGLQDNPLYQSMIASGEAGKQAGEEAIMRQAGATGGLRSGNVQSNLYKFNTEFDTDLKNKALLATYEDQIQGLRGLANLPGQTTNIAQTMGNIGATQAQGIVAQGQIAQQGIQGATNAVTSGVGNLLLAKGIGII